MSAVRLLCVSLTGFAVEWGWAVGESVMIPHLLARPLALAPSVAGLIYTVNPIFSFLITPLVGRGADGSRALSPSARRLVAFSNRRRFVACLAAFGLACIAALGATPLVGARSYEAAACFVFFGVVDLCHDLILVPGRSLLVAMWPEAGDDEDGDALYSLSQLFGRGLGLVAIAVVPARGLLGTSYFQTSWALSAGVLFATTAAALAAAAPRRRKDEEEEEDDDGDVVASSSARPAPTAALALVLTIQFVGWVGLTTFTFWSTTWLGLGTKLRGASLPLVALAAQTFVGVGVGPFLPRANRCFGAAAVWILGELLLLGAVAASRWLGPERPVATLVVVALSGASFAPHTSNAQILCRRFSRDEAALSTAAALVNNTMTAAQILVGGLAGLLVNCGASEFGCRSVGAGLFWGVGVGGAAVDVALVVLDLCYLRSGAFAERRPRDRSLQEPLLDEPPAAAVPPLTPGPALAILAPIV
jgi:solute carrier family 45 protein 1/2/4